MADSIYSSGVEAMLLSVMLLCVALAMLVLRSLGKSTYSPLLSPTGWIAFCSATWLAAASPIMHQIHIPIFWDLISLTALYFLPVGVCQFVSRSFASDDSSPVLYYLKRCHVLYAMASIIAIASNIISPVRSMKLFLVLSGITALILGYITYRAIAVGDNRAKLFATGAGIMGACLLLDSAVTNLNLKLPFAWPAQWGFFVWICLLVALIRRQILLTAEHDRQIAEKLARENKTLKKVFSATKIVTNEVAEDNQLLSASLRDRSAHIEQIEQRVARDQLTLQKTKERLIETERFSQLGVMVAGLAHELNTPLGVGVTAASNLEREVEELHDLLDSGAMKKSDLERYLQVSGESASMILANLRGASELVKSFKAVAADQNLDNRREFPLKEYLGKIVLSLKPRTAQTPHSIKIACAEDITLYGQPGAFSQVITNLIMNSLTHAFEPGQSGTISIDAFRDTKYVSIRFADNGKGIPPDVLPRIFEPFYTTRAGDGGTGLGLHIVYNIVTEQFAGDITCESQVGKGTTFYLRFPLREERENVR